jgi:hypothetical protein
LMVVVCALWLVAGSAHTIVARNIWWLAGAETTTWWGLLLATGTLFGLVGTSPCGWHCG